MAELEPEGAQDISSVAATVRVPVRDGDWREVPADAAAQWDARLWHDRPPI
jgi:hypothetical protein